MLQAAALAVSQYLMAMCNQQSDESDISDSESEHESSPPLKPEPTPSNNAPTHTSKAKKIKANQPPLPPVVTQLMEMGFPRKNVEFAIKAIGMNI